MRKFILKQAKIQILTEDNEVNYWFNQLANLCINSDFIDDEFDDIYRELRRKAMCKFNIIEELQKRACFPKSSLYDKIIEMICIQIIRYEKENNVIPCQKINYGS